MRIGAAVAEVGVVSTCTVFLRGSAQAHWPVVVSAWDEFLHSAGLGAAPLRCRRGALAKWMRLPDDREQVSLLLDGAETGAGCRRLQIATEESTDGVVLEWVDLLPVLGNERASHVRLRCPRHARPLDVVRFAEWTVRNLPLHWGSAGFAFEHASGPRHIAYARIAAMAKRYWGIQIQDLTTLQWDALGGIAGVNWLTLIGNDFAALKGGGVGSIAARAAVLAHHGVHCRQAALGVMLAAGAEPSLGDINVDDSLRAHALVAELIRPFLLQEHLPLAGPFSRREVMAAWLRRIENPDDWLRCDIADRAD